MSGKPQPKKPDRRPTSVVFSKCGKVSPNSESLPCHQDEIEIAIGRKFAGALRHFHDSNLAVLGSGYVQNNSSQDHRADIICQDDAGHQIKVQLVEVVDPVQAILNARRSTYADALETDNDIMQLFTGCHLTFIDSRNAPFLPRIESREGQRSLSEVLRNLEAFGSDIGTLQVGKYRCYKISVGAIPIELFIRCERLASSDSETQYSHTWGGGRTILPTESRTYLAEAVLKKIRHAYAKPPGRFWLLAYSIDTIIHEGDKDLEQTRNALQRHQHPFDAVWYLFPYPNRELGHLVPVWKG